MTEHQGSPTIHTYHTPLPLLFPPSFPPSPQPLLFCLLLPTAIARTVGRLRLPLLLLLLLLSIRRRVPRLLHLTIFDLLCVAMDSSVRI